MSRWKTSPGSTMLSSAIPTVKLAMVSPGFMVMVMGVGSKSSLAGGEVGRGPWGTREEADVYKL